MRISLSRWLSGLAVALAAACSADGIGPGSNPARVDVVGAPATLATVGAELQTPIAVRVLDASGRPVPNVPVGFTVTAGNGFVARSNATSDGDGRAATTFTVGTSSGENEVTVKAAGVTAPARFQMSGVAGPLAELRIQGRWLLLKPGTDSAQIRGSGADRYGNATLGGLQWKPRDISLVTVDTSGLVRALRRGASTYILLSAAGLLDSVLVTVLASNDPPCTGAPERVELSVGQVLTGVSSNICVHSEDAETRYLLIPFYNSSVPSSRIPIEVITSRTADAPLTTVQPHLLPEQLRSAPGPIAHVPVRADAFELALRDRERRELAPLVSGARAWQRQREGMRSPAFSSTARSAAGITQPAAGTIAAPVSVGDFLTFNTNPLSGCADPSYRGARVAAVTDGAIVVADTSNPPDGFSDAEYREMALTFDTLIAPVDVDAFGAPSDIDGNGRVIMFFTSAVNEISAGPGAVVLGFFYSRDLYPTTVAEGQGCEGSNVAEMFYLRVPDAQTPKSFVTNTTASTIAHEYQHLINASRRLYVNHAPEVDEEVWLNEGLSHIAEELVFYRASGLSPRGNLDRTLGASSMQLTAWQTFARQNFLRYGIYLQATESQGPIGATGSDSDLSTRGAIWSFLRYAADQSGTSDGDIWYRLVNSPTTGMANLTNVLGSDARMAMRDWAISVYVDDFIPGLSGRYQQPSWNTRSVVTMDGSGLSSFALLPRFLVDGRTRTALSAGGTGFFYFPVAPHSDAILNVTSGGDPIPDAVLLSIIRIR